MAKLKAPSTKKAQIALEKSRMVIWACVAAFLVLFTLLVAWKMSGLIAYQNGVISAKKQAKNQLEANIAARDKLVAAYQVFNSGEQNVIGGSPQGSSGQNGSNAKIMIDALPDKYDFPHLVSSIENLAALSSVKIVGVSGSDDEVAQSQQTGSAQPEPVTMPFAVTVEGNYGQIEALLKNMESSIRPFKVLTILITADDDGVLTVDITAETYYQPTTRFQVEEKVHS